MDPSRLRRALDERRLAADSRAGKSVRAKVRRERYAFVRSNWLRLMFVPGLFVLSAGSGLAFARNDFQRGALVGGAIIGAAAVATYLVTQMTGTGARSMGALAEVWSASELRRLRRHGFKVVNHVMLKDGDIDHVLIGPPGCWVIETKWSASEWSRQAPDAWITRAVEQARANARSLRLWSDFRRAGIDTVEAVVLLWGSAAESIPVQSVVDGVTVVRGADGATAWRQSVLAIDDRLGVTAIDAAWNALAAQAVVRDEREDAGPPSVERITLLAVLVLVAGTGSFLLNLQAMMWIATRWGGIGAVLAVLAGLGLAACGLPVRRRQTFRAAGTAWVTGALCAVAAAAVGVFVLL